jgi:hypothetical protein
MGIQRPAGRDEALGGMEGVEAQSLDLGLRHPVGDPDLTERGETAKRRRDGEPEA